MEEWWKNGKFCCSYFVLFRANIILNGGWVGLYSPLTGNGRYESCGWIPCVGELFVKFFSTVRSSENPWVIVDRLTTFLHDDGGADSNRYDYHNPTSILYSRPSHIILPSSSTIYPHHTPNISTKQVKQTTKTSPLKNGRLRTLPQRSPRPEPTFRRSSLRRRIRNHRHRPPTGQPHLGTESSLLPRTLHSPRHKARRH